MNTDRQTDRPKLQNNRSSIEISGQIWTDLSSVLSQCTRLTDGQTDGRTDGRTEFLSLDRVCIPCSAVKMVYFCLTV